MSNIEFLLDKMTILTAQEARQITEVKAANKKRLDELLFRCHTYIKAAAIKGEDFVRMDNIPSLISDELQKNLEALGYEVAVDDYADGTPTAFGISW